MSFWKDRLLFLVIAVAGFDAKSQELFVVNEPASSTPKGVFGARVYYQTYSELGTSRNLFVARAMYGVTSKLSVAVNVSMSNHHDNKLPKDLINHTHSGNNTYYYTQAIRRGVKYPYLFSGFYAFAKYRFLSLDQQNQHFRVALYGEWSDVHVPHDEAEPNLVDDTGGYGGGLIATWLKNRFAASLTSGFIKPNSYFENQTDFSGGPDLPTKISYGDAIKYNLSFGYRLSPKKYENYEQVNWNIYMEFTGKSYEGARVIQNGTEITTRAEALKKGTYLEANPGVQRIVNSNMRLEFYCTFSLLGNSYVHFTPMWTIAIQRYFYRPKREVAKKL